MTERLYYNDPYLSAFDAVVLDSGSDGRTLTLDRTAFYPTSGGQPNDLGTIAGVPVTDVRDQDGTIVHITAEPVASGLANAEIDWRRRYDHMQQHTGQHLLSAVFVELLSAPTLSFHMGSEVSTVELGCANLSETGIDRVEDRANELARSGLSVTISYSEADAAEGLRKPSTRSGELRIISIDGIDRSACGGTHVRSTAELAPIHIRRTEKLRGNTRVEFVCGTRALVRSRRDYRIAAELARSLTSPLDELPRTVSNLRMRVTELEKERERLAASLARAEGTQLHRDVTLDADGFRRVFLDVPAIDDSVRSKLQAFAAQGKAIALAIGSEPAGVLLVCSPDAGVNAGPVLKEALSKAGGKGGGSQTMAQGTLPDPALIPDLKSRFGFAPG